MNMCNCKGFQSICRRRKEKNRGNILGKSTTKREGQCDTQQTSNVCLQLKLQVV